MTAVGPSAGTGPGGDDVVDELDIAQTKVGESAQRVVDRAVDETRRREHGEVTSEHLFLAFSQLEWDTFSEVMRDLSLNPHEIVQALEEHLRSLPASDPGKPRVTASAKDVLKLAYHHASRAGRQLVESSDLFVALFEES